jgi:small subunit ribosomal protein S3
VPIDYGFAEAKTTYGIIGIKCWINKKEEIEKPKRETGGGPRRDPKGRRARQTQSK